jgi:metal-sulfur cluster biosynthetic enzyme
MVWFLSRLGNIVAGPFDGHRLVARFYERAGRSDDLIGASAYTWRMTIDSNLAKVDEVMTALYDIHDPEIGMSIVDLDLIKGVEIGADGAPTEIKMVLTTPFCPWAGELIQDVKAKTEAVVGPPVKVTLLADRWEPPPGLF